MKKMYIILLSLLMSIMLCPLSVRADSWSPEGKTCVGSLTEAAPLTVPVNYSDEDNVEYVSIVPDESATYKIFTTGTSSRMYYAELYDYTGRQLDSYNHFVCGFDIEMVRPLKKDVQYYLVIYKYSSSDVECTINLEQTTDYWAVITYDDNDNKVDATRSPVDGLTWDPENNRLTLNGYNGKSIWVVNRGEEYSEYAHTDVEICIKGENAISKKYDDAIKIYDANALITGDGTLNIDGTAVDGGRGLGTAIYVDGNLTIDGPKINAANIRTFIYLQRTKFTEMGSDGKIFGDWSYNGEFTMKSGTLIAEQIPTTSTYSSGVRYRRKLNNAITANSYNVTGGDIAVHFKYTEPTEDEKDMPFDTGNIAVLFINSFIDMEYTVENCSIGYKLDDELKEYYNVYAIANGAESNIEKILRHTVEDMDNVTALDIETIFPSDKEPEPDTSSEQNTPSAPVTPSDDKEIDPSGGDGNDNNSSTGGGSDNGNNGSTGGGSAGNDSNADVDSSLEIGTVFDDGVYSYKVIKKSQNAGKTVYEASVTGLIKKKVTSCKIADTVKKDEIVCNVTDISSGAFANNKKFKKITIGKNVKKIGNKAFYKNTKVTAVTVNSTKLEEIGSNSFSGMGKLKNVTIKSTVLKKIGKKAFYGDNKLSKVILKTKKLSKVGSKAFYKKKGKKIQVKVPKAKKKKYKKLIKNVKIV